MSHIVIKAYDDKEQEIPKATAFIHLGPGQAGSPTQLRTARRWAKTALATHKALFTQVTIGERVMAQYNRIRRK